MGNDKKTNLFIKMWEYFSTHRDILYITCIVVLSLILGYQCSRNSGLDNEVVRLENNIYAIRDTLTQYKDDNGRIIAERHAFQLTEKELRDSVSLLKTKNREYLSYINAHIGIRDTIEIPTYIDRPDTIYYADQGTIKFNRSDTFGKSKRELTVSIPYIFNDKLLTGTADVDMYHDIFVETMIEKDTKTGETYVRLISDYPYLSFNSGFGASILNSKSYERSLRKTKGIGIAVGPSIGMGWDMMNKNISPTIGVSLTIGFTYTPRWAQW